MTALDPIRKAAQYALGAMALVIIAASDQGYTAQEIVSIALAFFGTFLVYVAGSDQLKMFVAGIVAALEFLQVSLSVDGGFDDLTSSHWLQVGVFLLVGAGVVIVPNRGPEPVST